MNSLSPGGVKTNQSKYFVNKISKMIPLGRMAYKYEYKDDDDLNVITNFKT